MGWSIPWVSTARTDFNFDLGFSSSEGQTREWVEPMAEQLPPIAVHNSRSTGTDLVGYLTELFGFQLVRTRRFGEALLRLLRRTRRSVRDVDRLLLPFTNRRRNTIAFYAAGVRWPIRAAARRSCRSSRRTRVQKRRAANRSAIGLGAD
jgi:hypothetical protein